MDKSPLNKSSHSFVFVLMIKMLNKTTLKVCTSTGGQLDTGFLLTWLGTCACRTDLQKYYAYTEGSSQRQSNITKGDDKQEMLTTSLSLFHCLFLSLFLSVPQKNRLSKEWQDDLHSYRTGLFGL